MADKLKGTDAMIAALRKIKENFPDRVGSALYRKAQVLMTESKRRTPVKTGVLRASGYVEEPKRNGQKISVTLGFGGAAADYAVPVHENLEAEHTVGQAKYLESVLDEAVAETGGELAAEMHFDRRKV